MSLTLNYYILLKNEGKYAELEHVWSDETVAGIRGSIFDRQRSLFREHYGHDIAEASLQLYKPRDLKVKHNGNLLESANESIRGVDALNETDRIQDDGVFGKNGLDASLIHLVVALETTFEQPRNPLSSAICPRQATVTGIWDKLMKYRFIWARGTPGSGKTILTKLLYQHAKLTVPGVTVIKFTSWMPAWERSNLHKTWEDIFHDRGWKSGSGVVTIFIFDDAQQTYSDRELWGSFFKNVRDFDKAYAIGFASYGSALSYYDVGGGTSMDISPRQRISLRPIDHNDGCAAIGMLFTKEDFDDTVERIYMDQGGHYFGKSFLDGLFEVTGGHIGAIVDVLHLIEASDTYSTIKRSGISSRFSWDTFQAQFPPDEFARQIGSDASIFKRGLPYYKDLKDVEVSKALSAVAQRTVVKANEVPGDILDSLQQCVHRGWLYTDNIVDGAVETVGYVFASSLHQWYVEWKLFREQSSDLEEPREANLKEFALAVIQTFNPKVLQEKRTVGAACVQRPSEAQFQDEFYRSGHEDSRGSLVTFPEYGTAKGRVDFYVPSRQWGIELLHDGDRLEQHSVRFSQPGTYRGSLSVKDYIMLDFCTTVPRSKHPHINNLYHIVFKNNYEEVTVLDNTNQMVVEFRLTRK